LLASTPAVQHLRSDGRELGKDSISEARPFSLSCTMISAGCRVEAAWALVRCWQPRELCSPWGSWLWAKPTASGGGLDNSPLISASKGDTCSLGGSFDQVNEVHATKRALCPTPPWHCTSRSCTSGSASGSSRLHPSVENYLAEVCQAAHDLSGTGLLPTHSATTAPQSGLGRSSVAQA
jgi:hypothetical protein